MQLAQPGREAGLVMWQAPINLGKEQLLEAKNRVLAGAATALAYEHAGACYADMIPGLLDLAGERCRQAGDPPALRKRLVHVLLETVDNITRHAKGAFGGSSFVLLARDGKEWVVACGNLVPAATAVLMMHRMSILNSMGRDDLREHYLKLLAKGGRTKNGGAGLGLLTLARKAARPILVSMEPVGPYTSYLKFELRVALQPGQDSPTAA
jgi:hypothetical protein